MRLTTRLIVVVGLVSMIVINISSADETETLQLQEVSGTLTWVRSDGTVRLQRNVDMTLDPTGRYRVVTASLDGTRAREEITYDGVGVQTAVIVDPGGRASVLTVHSSAHFAIDNHSARHVDATLTVADGFVLKGLDESVVFDIGMAKQYRGSHAELQAEVPDDARLLSARLDDSFTIDTDASPTAIGTATMMMRDLLGYECLTAWNKRNTVTDEFWAKSTYAGRCWYVDVSAWGWGHGTPGFSYACLYPWHGSGPTAIGTSALYRIFPSLGETGHPNAVGDPVCSTHAGWDRDWLLHVSWMPLHASVIDY